ncbi:redoxin domain-containing protein [Rubrivirga sp.]|uniref:redoxin domain-containing protein n=1 Tax=Rubrivirga sp. TaxID=1885344 RepID=UPI003B52627C
MLRRLGLLGSLLALAACGPDPSAPDATVVQPTREAAPAVVLPTAEGPVDLASLAGRPVVLHFAAADDAEAWAALADALGDLEAAGAAVVAVSVDGAEDEAARAFGYDGAALAVVVDGEGTVRGRALPHSGDDLFALASPVLAEADVAATVSWPDPETLDALVALGGVVVDLSERGSPGVPHALRVAADTLAALDLPADLGTPLAFVGPDAAEAASRATRWGYVAVFVADADGTITAVEPAPVARDRPLRSGGVRG